MPVDWRLEDVNDGTYDDRLLDVPDCTLAFSRFARSAKAEFDDPDGTVPSEYPRGAPVDLEVTRNIDDAYSTRLGGFVNGYESGQNTTTLKLLSHDSWLRGRNVYRSFTDTAKSTIIKELVTDLTPLEWDASRVDVYDDAAIDAEWSGEALDKVLEELSAASNDELFGATNDMVFFFEQRDTSRAPRDFTAGEYFPDSAEFEEDGSVELNEVTVYYGGQPADSAVIEEDRAAQKALQNELGASSPVVISDSKTYTKISTEEAARRKAEQILSGATAITTGELTTWEAFDVDPGDLVRVVVPEQGIDDEFRVAEITHSWQDDETSVKLAENSDGVVDTLVELSDEVSRVEARPADNNATITRFTTFDLPFEVAWTLNVYRRSVPDDALLWGSTKGGWGDPAAGGGRWGDQRGEREQLIQK
jgi:hypothetical protein